MTLSHPPLDFPIYGLPPGPEPRWLDGVEGRLGSPATGVWLGHGSVPRDHQRPWSRVGTFRRDRFPGPGVVDAAEWAAERALTAVVDATMPDPTKGSEEHNRHLRDVALNRAGAPTEWRRVAWTVDDANVSARVADWAGAWAAWTTALSEVDLIAIGFGFDPAGLVFAHVQDGSPYHFDLGKPIAFPDTVKRARAAVGVGHDSTDVMWWPVHSDHDIAAE